MEYEIITDEMFEKFVIRNSLDHGFADSIADFINKKECSLEIEGAELTIKMKIKQW